MFIAIVGSRKCTSAESRAAYDLAFYLAKSGHTVVSGLARGVDTAALLGAAGAKAPSVAILPTAPNEGVYPAASAVLVKQLQKNGGVVVAPYSSSSDAAWRLKRRLIERNYLTALWCELCIVVSDRPVIGGGTSWMVSFCQAQGKTVLRFSSDYLLHYNVESACRVVTWEPELKALKEHIRLPRA